MSLESLPEMGNFLDVFQEFDKKQLLVKEMTLWEFFSSLQVAQTHLRSFLLSYNCNKGSASKELLGKNIYHQVDCITPLCNNWSTL